MKKMAFLVLAAIMLTSCGQGVPTDKLYSNGTKATYQIFIDDINVGKMIYTFKEGVYEGRKSLTIESDANYTYKDPRQPQNFEIKSKTTSIVDADSWKPLYSYFKLEWKGTMNGFNETESKYGEKNVSWTNKYPNGSYSKEVKFYEEFHDEDSVMWFTPTLGYEKDKQRLFTYFANRTAEPTQGMIWMGGTTKLEVRGKKYNAWAAGIRCNEIVERVWYDMETNRLVRYEQDMGFLAYPDSNPKKPAGWEPPKTTFALVLDSWETK